MSPSTQIQARDQVLLEIPELLEAILHQLAIISPRELLTTTPRVCHHWAFVINDSQRLQEWLFFSAPKSTTRARTWNSLEVNPLLAAVFPFRLVQPHNFKLLKSGFLRARTFREAGMTQYMRAVSREESAWRIEERFSRAEASWRRMLVAQPILVSKPKPPSATDFDAEAFETRAERLRMGNVYDKACMLPFGEYGPFGIRIEWDRDQTGLVLSADAKQLMDRFSTTLVQFGAHQIPDDQRTIIAEGEVEYWL